MTDMPALTRTFFIAFVSILLLAAVQISEARWAKPDDMDYAVESRNWDVWIEKDGTYIEEIDEKTLILKDSARMTQGMVRLNYNPEVTKIEVLAAETLNGDRTLSVASQFIEDKPLASSGEGFDHWRQILIAFPGVDLGSKVHLKYRKTWTTVPVPGFYSESFYYGLEYQKAGVFRFHSKIPLVTSFNDSENVLNVKKTEREKSDFPYRVEVSLKQPVIKSIADEQDPFLDLTKVPSFRLATSRDWSMISKSVIAQYESVAGSPLPPAFQKIADHARAIKDEVDRINDVTSRLADLVRYLGDWRTLKGQWIPRPLKTIAASQFGDCKDFAISVTAIMRNLGMNADVAWVWRGWNPVVEPYDFPSIYRFNHAIARVRSHDREFWIDGTNVASFAQGIPGDISDRPALVLAEGASTLARVPASQAGDFAYSFTQRLDFSHPDGIHVDGTFRSKGGDVAGWINSNYNSSQKSLDMKLIRSAARTDSFRDWQVDGFHLNSRIVRELSAKFRYTESASGFRSTAGVVYPIFTPDVVDRLLFNADQRVSDFVIGEPFTYERDMQLLKISIVGQDPLDCSLDSPWVKINRVIAETPDGMKIHDQVTLKKALIRHSEYTKPEFRALQKKLVNCFRFSSVIYRDPQAKAKIR